MPTVIQARAVEFASRDFSHLFTVKAYRAAYRAGEIAAETGADIPHIDWALCVKLTCSDEYSDQEDLRQTVAAYDAGLIDGYYSQEPLSDMSIAIHFD